MSHPSLDHLRAHHGEFETFRDLMVATSAGRFGPVFWGVWQQYVAPTLPASPTLVDLGCGPGGLFAPLHERHPDAAIVGVEVQPAMLTTARENARAVGGRIIEADLAQPLPLADASADAVVASMVLHEMPWPTLLLREIHRCLRPGGAALIFDWVRQPLETYVGDAELTPDLLQHFREHCAFTPEDLVFLSRSAGLQVAEVIGRRGGQHVMLALHKPAHAPATA